MLKRFRNYVETSDWERCLDDDCTALTVFCWVAIIFSVCWFVPTIIRLMVYGPQP